MSSNYSAIGLLAKLGPKLAKFLSPVFKLLKSGKLLKVGLAGSSFAAYSHLFTWEFAVIILTSLLIHEYGHLSAMSWRGMDHKGMYFVPLLGAAAVPEEDFQSHYDEAFVAAMGPVFGLATAFVAAGVYFLTSAPIAAAAASWIALINLFNLLPVKPLDGGRIMSALSFSISSRAGFAITFGALAVATVGGVIAGLGIIYLIVPLGALEMYGEYRRTQKGLDPEQSLSDHSLQKIYSTFQAVPLDSLDQSTQDRVPDALVDEVVTKKKIVVEDIFDGSETETGTAQVRIAVPSEEEPEAMIPESLFWDLLHEDELSRKKPAMTNQRVLGTMAVYLALGVVLLAVMVLMRDVPGAAAAMEALK